MKINLYIITVMLFLCSCNKEEYTHVDSLEPEQKEITMMVNEDTTLRVAKFHPQEPVKYELRWRSDDSPSLIDLDSISGKVTAKVPGDAHIQIFLNNEFKGSCKIHIEGVVDESNDVYICGIKDNKPVYWKNGFVHALETDKPYSNITLSAIEVYNNDVYVVGATSGHDQDIYSDEMICWKNGKQIFSSQQGTYNNYELCVQNNDYYILGCITDPVEQKTTIWKNGGRTNFLLENGTYIHSIFVSNNDVYVAGETTYNLQQIDETTYRDCTIAKYWKNGLETCLTDSNSIAGASGIAVAGQDLYVVGWKLENGTSAARYWKNGQEFNLNDNNEWSAAQSITISNNDIYIMGIQKSKDNYIPVYWKNGIKTILENEEDFCYSPNITVSKNGDAYITPTSDDYKNYYLKNGKRVYFAKLYPDYPQLMGIKVVSK